MDWVMLSSEWEGGDAVVQTVAEGWGWTLLVWAACALVVLLVTQLVMGPALKRRRFWCSQAKREVEVVFEERGWVGLRRPVAVRACSVFEPAFAVGCSRSCLDRDRRVRLPMPFLPGSRP
jgi:hypothetical protein